MSVLSIETFELKGDILNVEAWIDNAVVVFRASMLDPVEYGPALCSASFMVDPEDEDIDMKNLTEEDVMQLINEINPEWIPVDVSDSDYF